MFRMRIAVPAYAGLTEHFGACCAQPRRVNRNAFGSAMILDSSHRHFLGRIGLGFAGPGSSVPDGRRLRT
jgi:hypothetical protein